MKEWRAGHRDEIRERIGSRHRALGENADRAGLTLGILTREELVDDVAELFAVAQSLHGDARQQHPSPRRFAEPFVARHRDDVTGEPGILSVEDRAAFEPERDLS